MDFIKYIDFFNIKFHFYTNNQPNYQNVFGGIMNLIYILGCILIFIFFSYDDLKLLNPNATISEISDSEARIINLKEEKIWIPFRMVTYENKLIQHKGILHIEPYFIEGKYNNNNQMDLHYHLLNYKLCNETSMANKPNNYRINAHLNELYCIDQDDILFGGSWNSDFIYYIEINLYLCDENIYFNSSDPRCEKVVDLLKTLNSSILFEFYYPVVQFQPRNIEIPVAIIYKNFYYRLSTYSRKVEKIFIHEHILSDDKNMLRSNYKNSSCWGVSFLYGDDYSLQEKYDPIAKSNSSIAYSLNIYMDNGFVYYTRSYNKLFLIFSNVFPLFKFLLYFMKNFTQHIKMSLTKRKLASLVFEFKGLKLKNIFINKIEEINKNSNLQNESKIVESKQNKDNKENKIKHINLSNNFLSINIYKLNDKDNNEHKNNIKEENKENKYYNNRSNVFLNEENQISILNKKDIISNNKSNKSNLFESLKTKISPKKIRKKKKQYLFPTYYFFLDFFLDKLIHPQRFFCLPKAYFTVYNFMCQIFDISTHIILFKHFNSLDKLIKEKAYEKDGVCQIKPYKKINLSDEKKVEKINKDLKSNKSILFSNNLL